MTYTRLAVFVFIGALICKTSTANPAINYDKTLFDEDLMMEPSITDVDFDEDDANDGKAAVKQVCYDDLGCFSTNKPWKAFGRIARLPKSPQEIDTQFFLFTRRNADNWVRITANDIGSLIQSPYDGSKPTKFIVHGFTDDARKPWLKIMSNQFLKEGDVNVFCVEWERGAGGWYGQAAANARIVGAEIVKMVRFLSNYTGLKHENVHIIGHSLGAHIGGYVGYELKDLGRVTGMDPAGPYFQNMDPLVRLDETDAKFVDVIHTDGSSIVNTLVLEGGFGIWTPSGHVDVYVNGGKKQPDCGENPTEPADGFLQTVKQIASCYHRRSIGIAVTTIASSCPYRSYSCQDWEEFQTGRCLHCPSDDGTKCNGVGSTAFKPKDGSVNRMYYLATSGDFPYCLYHYHVQLKLSRKWNDEQKGNVWFRLIGNRASSQFFAVNNGDYLSLEYGSINDFLVTSPNDLGESIQGVEIYWEHDASWFDVTQWFKENPKIYLEKVTVFSGERQNKFSFCERSKEPLESEQFRTLSTNC